MDASSKEEMQFRCQLANKLAAITAAQKTIWNIAERL